MTGVQRETLTPMLAVQRETLARMLLEHGEDDLAGRALSFSDVEMDRIGTLGAYYAFSEDAMTLGGSMGGSRALALATIDVLDRAGRALHREVTDQSDVADAIQDRELRRHFVERQIPADESKRILDNLDPPAWGPAPSGATPAIKRCHELRTKPLRDFTAEDLRFMIEQEVGLSRLVGLALTRLRNDPLLEAERYPGDLLASVLCVDNAFWEPEFDLEVEARKIAEGLRSQPELEPGLPKLIDTFVREHPPRSAACCPD